MKKLIYLSAFVLTTLVSCTQEDGLKTGPNATIVGFPSTTVTSQNFTDVPQDQVNVVLNYISYANETIPSDDVTVTWEVDQANSTAVEGYEYDFTSTSRQLTIVGGETVILLPIDVYPVNFDVNDPTKLVLKLTMVDSNNAIIGVQYESVNVVFQGVCPSNLAGEYYITFASGPQAITITSTGPGLYSASYLPTFSSVYSWSFSDVCGDLTLTNWQFESSNPMSGTSSPRPHGTINGDGSITFTGVNVAGVSWYVDKTWTIYPL
jgi:hypothetical protein